jgi:hypothetical protein
VFIGFTLSQVGMVRHWHSQRSSGWLYRAWINGIGAVLTFAATMIELVSKFLARRVLPRAVAGVAARGAADHAAVRAPVAG